MYLRKIFISGVSGFIGRYLANYFLSRECEVWGLSRSECPQIQHKDFHWIQSDLGTEVPSLPVVDVCIHSAALSPATGLGTFDYVRNNVQGTQNLLAGLKTCASCRSVYFLSGVSVYGQVREPFVNEETLPVAPEAYGMSKLLAEQLLMEQADIPVTIFRLPGVLGPGSQTPWLVKQIRKALRNENIQAYNPDALFNNVVWVKDLAYFIEHLGQQNEVPLKTLFLLAAKEPMSIQSILQYLLEQTKSSSELQFAGGRPSFQLDFSRATQAGYKPRSLMKMLQEQMEHEEKLFHAAD